MKVYVHIENEKVVGVSSSTTLALSFAVDHRGKNRTVLAFDLQTNPRVVSKSKRGRLRNKK